MYYLLNYIFICFLTIAIALVYTKETSITFVLVFLIIAIAVKLFESAYATWKYNALADRLKKLESKNKEDK